MSHRAHVEENLQLVRVEPTLPKSYGLFPSRTGIPAVHFLNLEDCNRQTEVCRTNALLRCPNKNSIPLPSSGRITLPTQQPRNPPLHAVGTTAGTLCLLGFIAVGKWCCFRWPSFRLRRGVVWPFFIEKNRPATFPTSPLVVHRRLQNDRINDCRKDDRGSRARAAVAVSCKLLVPLQRSWVIGHLQFSTFQWPDRLPGPCPLSSILESCFQAYAPWH